MKQKISFFLIVAFLLSISAQYGFGQNWVEAYSTKNTTKKGYLGVGIQDVKKKLKEKESLSADRGAFVTDVVEDSPAERAGLEKGDVILKFGDEAVYDGDDLTEAVRETKPKTEVKVEIERKGQKKVLTAVVGKLKSPIAMTYSLGDGEVFSSVPSVPKLDKTFDIHVSTMTNVEGLKLQSLTKQLGEYFGTPGGKGILVTEVKQGTEAEKAGFKAGDVIIKVNENGVDDMDEMDEEIADADGKDVPFEIIRNGKATKLSMKIEAEDEGEEEMGIKKHIIVKPRIGGLNVMPENDHMEFELDRLKEHLGDIKRTINDQMRLVKRTLIRTFNEL